MALLAISLPADLPTSELLARLELTQRDLPSPEDACLVLRDLRGEVRVQQSVYVPPRGAAGTFWIALVQRVLALHKRSSAAVAHVLQPGTVTLLVVTRTQLVHDRMLALAQTVGEHVLDMPLSRQHEFALHLACLMPNAARSAA